MWNPENPLLGYVQLMVYELVEVASMNCFPEAA